MISGLKMIISLLLMLAFSLSAPAENKVSIIYKPLLSLPSDSLLKKGDYYFNSSHKDSALVYYSILSDRYYTGDQDESSLRIYIQAMYRLQMCYTYSFYDYKKASEYIVIAMHLAKKNKFDDLLPQLYNGIACLYLSDYMVSDHQQSLIYGLKNLNAAFDFSVKEKDWNQAVTSAMNLAEVAHANGKWSLASPTVKRMMALDIPSTPISDYTKLYCKGLLFYHAGKYEKALSCYNQMLEVSAKGGENKLRMEVLGKFNIGEVYLALKEYAKALVPLKEVEAVAKSTESWDLLMEVSKNLSDVEAEMGNKEAAELYHRQYLECKDSLISQSNVTDVRNIRLLEQLATMNDEAKESAKREKRIDMLLYVGSGALVIVCLLLLLYFWRFRTMRRKNKLLYEKYAAMLENEKTADKPANDSADAPKTPRVEKLEAEDLGVRIRYVLMNSEKVFEPDFSVKQLAELVDDRPWIVSQVINDTFGKNFSMLLAEYRIKEACRRMSNPDYDNQTLESIGESLGFKSRSNFSRLFKQVTGLTPSEYFRQAKKNREEK